MTQFVDANLVKEILENSKGRFLGITVEKKDGSERKFNFQACKDNAPAFKFHKDLVSIHENGQGFKSFNINKVKELHFNGQTLKAS